MSIHTASFPAVNEPDLTAKRPATLVHDAVGAWADHHRFWILALVIVVYLTGFTGKWLPESDSALYLSLGRSLALGNGYTDLGQPNHLVYPGLPWMIAGTFKIFGVDHLFPIHLILLLFAWATLAMIYTMMQLRTDRPTAVMVTGIVALSDTFFRYAMKVLTDMPFMAGVMAVLLGCELVGWFRRRDSDPSVPREKSGLGWSLIIAGLALATIMRPVIWALLFTLIAAAILSCISKRASWKYLLIAGLAVMMIAAFFVLDPRRTGDTGVLGIYESTVIASLRTGAMFQHMIHENFAQVFGATTAEAVLGMRVGPVLNQIVAVLAIAMGVGLWRRQPLWSLWVAISLLMMLALLPVRRYYLPILPFLMLGCWLGMGWLNRRIGDRGIANVICAALLIVLAGSNVVRCANFSLQQHGIFVDSKGDRQGEQIMTSDLGRKLNHRLPANATILAPRRMARILGYLSSRHTLAAGPGVQLTDLHSPAYLIMPTAADDGLINADLARLGLKPGRKIFDENASPEFQYVVYQLDLPKSH